MLSGDIKFRGKLYFRDSLHVNGRIKGQIETPGHLIIGPEGEIEADIEAGSVLIEGYAKGNIVASERVDLKKTARLVGDIRTPILSAEAGSKFRGSCLMD